VGDDVGICRRKWFIENLPGRAIEQARVDTRPAAIEGDSTMRITPLILAALATGTTLATTLAAIATVAIPREARACGGTFCDSGPAAMPVDQSGENILFVMGEGFTEAHIQIQYVPEPGVEKFAWVIPLTALPEFEVGSDPLFDQVLASTVPSYGFNTVFTGQDCGESGFGDGGSGGGSDGTGAAGEDGGSSGGGPEIVLQEVVGAFEITVLSGGTAQELVDWLDANDYAQDPNATPIIEEYLSEGYLFAAFKLANDAAVDEIHPVVLRFPVEEACVPLRLTRIAAVEDMAVRSFFLADARVVPETYRHVLVNPLKLDWPSFASNYSEVVTLAVDAESADGRAFVTEYAGPTDIVPRAGIFSAQWNAEPYRTAVPLEAFGLLRDQGLLDCFDDFEGPVCAYGHPLLRNLMLQYLPVPAGVDEVEFYGCPECYELEIDVAAWDGEAFADLLAERIILPGAHASMLLDGYPTLTRMYTTISPGEMTADPFFHENADLEGVDLTNQVATRGVGCGVDEVWTLPDGREVFVPGGVWPAFEDEMPWEEEVQEIASAGAPLSLVTRTELIDQLLFTHNCNYDHPSPEACGNAGTGSDTGEGTGEGTGGTGGTAGLDGELDDGCSCRSRGEGGGAALLLGLGLLGLGRRPRRR
jgi:MYXO-CTERM domain-containing protein